MDISKLEPGDHHYRAYVGPPARYDFMGATQFRLLCTLGLRANHYLLDFGCGSLRAGRLFISYLDEGGYFGIEPNQWLVTDGMNNQLGRDLVRIKKPQFNHNSDFKTDGFSRLFDFIVAQSIFSHADSACISKAFVNFKHSLKEDGLIAATFVEGARDSNADGWVYPGCVEYRASTILRFAEAAGLFATRIPWYHPRQTWYVLAKNRKRLPTKAMMRYLNGAVLGSSELADSWKPSLKAAKCVIGHARAIARALPEPMRNKLKRLNGGYGRRDV